MVIRVIVEADTKYVIVNNMDKFSTKRLTYYIFRRNIVSTAINRVCHAIPVYVFEKKQMLTHIYKILGNLSSNREPNDRVRIRSVRSPSSVSGA